MTASEGTATPKCRSVDPIYAVRWRRHSQRVVEGLCHKSDAGMCQLKQVWLRLLVFSPHLLPQYFLGYFAHSRQMPVFIAKE